MSEAAKKNISGAAIKGSTRSAITREKISNARKGIVFSEDHRRKLSEAAKSRRRK